MGRDGDSGAGLGVDRVAIWWRGRVLQEIRLFMIPMGA
jgi:hypothetical protein